MHTVIIGNGIVALTAAFRISRRMRPSDRMTIVGRADRAGSATLAAAAMLNSFAEIEAGSLSTDLDLYRFELSHLATRMWPKFESELIDAAAGCLPNGCRKCEGFKGGGCVSLGTYVVNNAAADDLDDENFDAIVEALQRFSEPHTHVHPRDIPNYAPEQRHRATRAVFIPNEGWFNPRLMIEKLDAILRQDTRIAIVDATAQRLEASGGVLAQVLLDNGSAIEGDKFLLATGATTTDLIRASNLDLPIQRVFYGVGVSVEIRSRDAPHTKCVRTPNRGLACGIYSTPYYTGPNEPNDHAIIGATNFLSPVPHGYGHLTSVAALMTAAIEQINVGFYRADLLRVNVGWRPTSLDTYPLVGPTSIPNLFVATGTKRDGFHLSPLLSEIITAMMLGDPVDTRFHAFAPERAPIRALTRKEAVDKAVRHRISAAYQHGFAPSHDRMPQQIDRMYRDDVERLHDQVGAIDWGIPPEMLDMYRYGHAQAS
jgi:glycine/D-amino acid oxidase-like deaminating enzyme